MKKFLAILYPLIFIILVSCSIDDPVSNDYFNDLNRVKGKNAPGVPNITSVTACNNVITINYTEATDPDGDELSYVFYYSFTDPSAFAVEDFYDPLRIAGLSSDDGGDVEFTTGYAGVIFFWLTAYDGGRESDHSPVVSVAVPGQSCP